MKHFLIGLMTASLLAFGQPVFAECGSSNQVEYIRSSQRPERGTDFRLKVAISDTVTADEPAADIKTTFIDETGDTFYSFVLTRVSEYSWEHNERTDTTYTRIRLTDNRDGTSTLRVAMRIPYTTYNNGLGYYASIRSCDQTF